jgi:hypothetical protein
MLFVPERRRSRFLCVCQAAVWSVVESGVAGSGSGLSEELVVGVEPAALDCGVAPWCPPGPAAPCSSLIMSRQIWSARRRFSSLSQVCGRVPPPSMVCGCSARSRSFSRGVLHLDRACAPAGLAGGGGTGGCEDLACLCRAGS